MLWGNDAPCVAEHTLALLQRRRRRPPSAREPRVEEGAGIRPCGEDGDRRHRAQSGRIECEVRPTAAARVEHDVVRVLVLRHDLDDRARRSLRAGPGQNIGERT